MSKKSKRREALLYHAKPRPGKIEVVPTKKYATQRDLALAYSPGVAEPCLEIEKDVNNVYKYTAKGNLVAVISNGTAVLGLGNIGPEASKPVMEGKGLLFKIFADIDVFDIEVNTEDIDSFVETVKNIAPTFGGINLEDIKAPEAFEIERRLKEELDIPVMHDDQHGTAIISAAALLNALEIVNKKIEDVLIVISGAGAAAGAIPRAPCDRSQRLVWHGISGRRRLRYGGRSAYGIGSHAALRCRAGASGDAARACRGIGSAITRSHGGRSGLGRGFHAAVERGGCGRYRPRSGAI